VVGEMTIVGQELHSGVATASWLAPGMMNSFVKKRENLTIKQMGITLELRETTIQP